MLTTIALVVWISCGVLAYGLTLGDFEGQYQRPAFDHRVIAGFMAFFGPFGLLAAVFSIITGGGFRHGLRWTRDTPSLEKPNE